MSSSYEKLKNTWVIKEKFITGHFGGIPSEAEIYAGYAIGYQYPVIMDSAMLGSCKKNKDKNRVILGVT